MIIFMVITNLITVIVIVIVMVITILDIQVQAAAEATDPNCHINSSFSG